MISSEVTLDRMALDEVGYRASDLAQEIRRQLDAPCGYVDVEQIAYSLDIIEVKSAPLTSFEGALITDAERSSGSILLNSLSGQLRGRFTIAHELLHFLNDRHVQTDAGFRCRATDIGHNKGKTSSNMSRHRRQETEANRFAIELLALRASFETYLKASPDLGHIRDVAKSMKLSKEAAARRYTELTEARIAMIFHRHGVVRYPDRVEEFPYLALTKGSTVLGIGVEAEVGSLTNFEEADPKDWFDGPLMGDFWVQTLQQINGFGITMLIWRMTIRKKTVAPKSSDCRRSTDRRI